MNRCKNTGAERTQPYLSSVGAMALREEIDRLIDQQIEDWYASVPYAAHFEGKQVNSRYYKRHLMETAWRIRLLRVAEAKALAEIAKRSPEAAQIWAHYEMEEMVHDELFVQDLECAGVSREAYLATEPYLSTKLLAGFFSYLLDHEGPLGVVAYSYLVETVNVKLDPRKLGAMKEALGEEEIAGQIAHANTDAEDDHPGEVWRALRLLMGGLEDVQALKRYLGELQQILAMYFDELHLDTVLNASCTLVEA